MTRSPLSSLIGRQPHQHRICIYFYSGFWDVLLLYLNVDGRIKDAVEQVSKLGGAVLEDVHSIGPHGFRAIVRDSEGNRVVLHSMTDE